VQNITIGGENMPEILMVFLIFINVVLGILIASSALDSLLHEKRAGYKWMWIYLIILGLLWAILYGMDLIPLGTDMHDLMGSGYIRSAITITLGAIYGIMLQLRIPRIK
jgi:hypothetical protein